LKRFSYLQTEFFPPSALKVKFKRKKTCADTVTCVYTNTSVETVEHVTKPRDAHIGAKNHVRLFSIRHSVYSHLYFKTPLKMMAVICQLILVRERGE